MFKNGVLQCTERERERVALEHSALNGMPSSNSSPRISGIYVEEEAGKSKPEVEDVSKGMASPRHNRTDACMTSQRP